MNKEKIKRKSNTKKVNKVCPIIIEPSASLSPLLRKRGKPKERLAKDRFLPLHWSKVYKEKCESEVRASENQSPFVEVSDNKMNCECSSKTDISSKCVKCMYGATSMSEIKRHEEDVHDAILDNKLNLSRCDDHKKV